MKLIRRIALFVLSAPLSAQITQAEYASRRAALAASLKADGVIVVLGAPEPRENYLTFWQSQHFNYLTGFQEPDAALLIVRRNGAEQEMLFVQPRDPAREVWTGARLGVEGVRTAMGIQGRPAGALRAVLDSLLASASTLYTVGDFSHGGGADVPGSAAPRTVDDQFVDALKLKYRSLAVSDISGQVSRLRGKKSPAELDLLRAAAKISAAAHREVLHAIAPGMNEFEVQALAEYTFRRNGADGPSYPSIVGSGPNSTTLHYNKDDRFMQAGEMLNMDMAAYYAGYAADLTRTVPVSGKFSPEQKDIYRIVYDAQQAAERQVKPGNAANQPNDSAVAVLKAGLARVGLIESPDATYDCGASEAPRKCGQYQLFYMHGLSHGIGLDVHDPDQFSQLRKFAEGSVFTIEPGVYVRANTVEIIPDMGANAQFKAKIRQAVRKYANIGVRIEDDYIVTNSGFERITAGAPREIEEIEREMAARSGPAARDAAAVESYRKIRP
ncbi:MAG TPA: Xaa-Pro aminopeptidase [Gemmatimonadaceae bacterium]|nr:Xaa-Pro aminopeptidase [Gemmatimonadaceae bacterium]